MSFEEGVPLWFFLTFILILGLIISAPLFMPAIFLKKRIRNYLIQWGYRPISIQRKSFGVYYDVIYEDNSGYRHHVYMASSLFDDKVYFAEDRIIGTAQNPPGSNWNTR